MKIRFNKFEKVAGLFVALAILSCVVGLAGVAVKKGWFSPKVHYAIELDSADGVHPGTIVQIAGLNVGSITAVNLRANNRVRVEFEVLAKFKNKIRQDSQVEMFRPFILADKVLDVSVGSADQPVLAEGSVLPVEPSYDVMDLLSGKKMSTMMASLNHLAESLKIVAQAFSDPRRTRDLVAMMDQLNPLVRHLNAMSIEFSRLGHVANRAAPAFSKEVPNVGEQLGQIVANLNILTTEFKKLTPAISAIAPDLPRTSRRAVEALDQTVVLLKAMQRSFLLRSDVEEVRKEENRRPANTSEP